MKMTKAGRLYLKDYYVLDEANSEMVEFLDDLLCRLELLFKEKQSELGNENYLWDSWKNKSTDGMIDFYMKPLAENIPRYFRKGKEDITLRIRDVRATTELNRTSSVILELYTNKSSKELISSIHNADPDFHNSEILKDAYIDLVLDNSEESATKIIQAAFILIHSVNKVLDELIEKYHKGEPVA